MTRLRPLAFTAAAAAASVAVLLAALLSPSTPPRRHQAPPAVHTAKAAAVSLASPPSPDTRPGRERRHSVARGGKPIARAAPARAPAMRTARRFAEHYLRWDHRDTGPAVRAGIAATASPQLARLVLSAPPRIPPGLDSPPVPARLLALQGELAPAGRRLDVRVELARGRELWGFQLVLRRSRQRWQVTRVRD